MIAIEDAIKHRIECILDAPTCYPERKRKTREQRYNDLMYWYDTYNDINEVYNFWGMDCIDAESLDEWLDRGLFRKQRHDINAFVYPNGSKFPMDYTVIMRDKRVFEGFCEMVLGLGNSYSPSIAYIVEKRFILKNGKTSEDVDFAKFLKKYESQLLVFKQVFGCSGETVKVVKIEDGKVVTWGGRKYAPAEFLSMLTNKKASNWIVQEYIVQHPKMKRLNETSVNTLRFITFHTGDDISIFPIIMMRYGVPGALVDNSSLGVGVDIDGTVMKWAFDLKSKTRLRCHEAGMEIPYFREAIDLVRHMHINIPEIFTVGWDVCITPSGPHIIEGNDGWDVVLHQAFDGCKMRNFWNEMVARYRDYYQNKE